MQHDVLPPTTEVGKKSVTKDKSLHFSPSVAFFQVSQREVQLKAKCVHLRMAGVELLIKWQSRTSRGFQLNSTGMSEKTGTPAVANETFSISTRGV